MKCGQCSAQAVEGKTRCQKHLDAAKKWFREHKLRYISEKLKKPKSLIEIAKEFVVQLKEKERALSIELGEVQGVLRQLAPKAPSPAASPLKAVRRRKKHRENLEGVILGLLSPTAPLSSVDLRRMLTPLFHERIPGETINGVLRRLERRGLCYISEKLKHKGKGLFLWKKQSKVQSAAADGGVKLGIGATR